MIADKILQFITVDEWILKVSRELIIRFIILRINCWAARHVRDSNFTKSDYLLNNYLMENYAAKNELGISELYHGMWTACAIKQCIDE